MLFAQGKITSWTKKNLPVNCLLSHNGAQLVQILFTGEFILFRTFNHKMFGFSVSLICQSHQHASNELFLTE